MFNSQVIRTNRIDKNRRYGQRSAHDSLKLKSAISCLQPLNLRVCCITCASDTTVYRHKFITSKQWRKQWQHLSFHSLDAENKPYTSDHGDSNYRHVIFWTILTSLKRAKMFTFYFSNCIMASKIVFEILRQIGTVLVQCSQWTTHCSYVDFYHLKSLSLSYTKSVSLAVFQ